MSNSANKSSTYQPSDEERARMKSNAKNQGTQLGVRGNENAKRLRDELLEVPKETPKND